MNTSSRILAAYTLALLVLAAGRTRVAYAQAGMPASVERIAIVGSADGIGVQIRASAPVTTEAQMLTGPDRLVIDFPGALPGRALRGLRLNQGEIKAVRTGLFRSNPPVTRVVVDLNAPTAYRLLPEGKTVIVKLGVEPEISGAAVPAALGTSGTTARQPMMASIAPVENIPGVTIDRHPTARALAALAAVPAAPPLRVRFDRGLLTISANKVTLADVLYQVHLKTGADIPIPSGAEQEQVAIQAGPGPAKDVLAALLNGSRFNYVLQGTAQDPQGVGAVILSPKANIGSEPVQPPMPEPAQPVGAPEGQLAAPTAPPNAPMQPDGSIAPPANPDEPQE